MFNSLTDSLQKVFKKLRGHGRLSEDNIREALREVRLAFLEADVQFQVARDFIVRVREKCVGADVTDSITPGQQVVKHVHDELVELLGGERGEFVLSDTPTCIMLLGLHGSGKTTTTAKLARLWKAEGRRVLLAACDIRRPAAVEQLSILAEQVGVDCLTPNQGETVPSIGKRALARAKEEGHQIVLFDTGGRFQIEDELVAELQELRDAVNPRHVMLVLDAAIGQESVHVAETFNEKVGLTGLILTKLDGDARGGASLSVRHVTGVPVLWVGTGERMEDLEPFHPERMASRILGMGDVVSLVEKAQQAVSEEDMKQMERRVLGQHLDLNDFLAQIQQLRKLGPMENLLEMLPAGANVPALDKGRLAEWSGTEMVRSEAIIRSMTPEERRRPGILDASRKRRIARGSGTDLAAVNGVLRQFDQARKMGKRLKKAQKKMSRLGGLMPGGGWK